MTPAQVRRKFFENLDLVPFARGVSNHMGSAYTSDPEAMERLLLCVREAGLFFFDSKTSPKSAVTLAAQRADVPSLANGAFLDNQDNAHYVQEKLEAVGRRVSRGQSVAVIGHYQRKHLVESLAKTLPAWKAQGVRIVYLSTLAQPAAPLKRGTSLSDGAAARRPGV